MANCSERELSFLLADRYEALLTAAGYQHHPIAGPPADAAADPLLRHWKRADHPSALDNARRAVFTTCLDLASLRKVMHHRLIRDQDVEQRRALFTSAIIDFADENAGPPQMLLAALEHCWNTYLAHGRRRFQERGEKVIVAPELASGYAVPDLVIGRTLIDVKLAVERLVVTGRRCERRRVGTTECPAGPPSRPEPEPCREVLRDRSRQPEPLVAAQPARSRDLQHRQARLLGQSHPGADHQIRVGRVS
ncbi:hypothetical protein [Amycolatopsis sp. lyj-346]|uniref:hypothetical protein n=1 Tax=Amycolatopsis sp. lyj-346 TaxID=2789289 RepID=UPI00397C2945